MTNPAKLRRPTRAALLGAGYIAQAHLRALKTRPEIELAAVCDVDDARAASLASLWQIPAVFHSLEELLQADINVVHILLPPPLHADAAVACLQRGCDVFLEKPMGVSEEECRRILVAARESGCRVGINHNFTYHPTFLELVKAVQQRRLGAIQHVTACVSVPLRQLAAGQHGHWMFESPGNIILEQACHPLSQIHALVGETAETLTLTSGETRLNTGAVFYRDWQIALRCERGTAQCFLSFGGDYFDFWVHVLGQDGAALLDMRRNTFALDEKSRFTEPVDHLLHTWRHSFDKAVQGTRNFISYSAGFLKPRSSRDPFSISFRNSLNSFYEARQRGLPPPVGPEQGLGVIETCARVMSATSSKDRLSTAKEYAAADF